MDSIQILIGMFLGGIIGFFVASYIKNKELAAEKRILDESKGNNDQLGPLFKSIATDVLREQKNDFRNDFEDKNREIHQTVQGLKDAVNIYEKERKEQFGALSENIKSVLTASTKVEETATNLKTVLSSASGIRGRWGEAALKDLLIQSGLSEGVNFLTQETIQNDEDQSQRPDVIINLPNDSQLAIDSKASLQEYFKYVEEKDEEKRKSHIAKFIQDIRGRVKDLSSKKYQKIDGKIPYVIMYVPSEPAVRTIFQEDANLYSEAQEQNVMIASPATIMPLIVLIAHAWKQHRSTENIQRVVKDIALLGDRLKIFMGHVVGIGGALKQATNKFNEMAGSWDARVYPVIDRINDKGARIDVEPDIPQIEVEPRIPHKVFEIEAQKPQEIE